MSDLNLLHKLANTGFVFMEDPVSQEVQVLIQIHADHLVWAQTSSTNLPAEVRADDATITHVGHATLTVEYKIVTDSLTRRTDTLRSVTNIEWDTPAGTAKRRNAEQDRGNNPNGSGFYNEGHSAWLDIYYYNYNYPSIDAGGKPVLLSAMASMSDEDCDHINNVIIGCHVTITSNKQCPSSYKDEGSKASDVGLLVNHSSSGMVFHSAQSDMAYYNLVILPDYEGYGLTRSHAHPLSLPGTHCKAGGGHHALRHRPLQELAHHQLDTPQLPQWLAHHQRGLLARRLGGLDHPPFHRAERPHR